MDQPLRVLHLEDNELDAELIALTLGNAGLAARITRVGSREAYLAAVSAGGFDVVLSDFSLPGFDGLAALAALRKQDEETPFIFISGTIGEDRAVHPLRQGATDYILKDRLSRRPPALEPSLAERPA